jgi:Reverse transcriptase (RNA-dependent DNA polymerase)/Endonuclease-reverse transcriptase
VSHNQKYCLKLNDEVINFHCPSKIKNNFFKIISLNAQSLANVDHILVFRHLLSDQIVDLIAVSETWLSSKNPDKLCNVEGYKLIRNDREGLRGGGVAFFVKNDVTFKIIATSPNTFDPTQVEFIFIEVTLQHTKILIVSLYRRPDIHCKFDKFFSELRKHTPTHDEIILLGDFNINFLDNTNKTTDFLTKLDDFNMYRLPIDHTHKSHNSLTTIDAIFVTAELDYNCFGKLPNLLSAHEILFIVLSLPHLIEGEEQIKIREFDTIKNEDLLEKAILVDWPLCSSMQSVDEKVTVFSEMLLGFFDSNLPLKVLPVKRKFKPKLPDTIKSAIRHRDRLRKLAYQVSSFLNIYERYKEVKNKVKQLVSTFHKGIIFSKLNNLKCSNHIWSSLRKLGLIKEKSFSNKLPENLDELAEGLTALPDIDSSKINFDYNLEPRTQVDKFYFSHVQPDKIKAAIFDIVTSAEGCDGICINMLKKIWQVIIFSVTNIVNSSMQMSYFPTLWKKAILSPVPKVRNPLSVKDFRPISLLCTASKILEKVVHDQILVFLNTQNIFDPFQSGYRKLYSTATALLKITEDFRNALLKRRVVLVVFLDFSKAFECVNHELLLRKLSQLNFSDPVVEWFRSYLTGRECAVKGKNGKFSKWVHVTSGVPQGSVLGPLLFSLYTHDISKILKNRCKYHIYADDIQLYIECSISELDEAIQIMNFILGDIVTWTESHGLKLNPTKTQAMLIATQNTRARINLQSLTPLTLNGTIIEYTDTVKNLGVHFDKHLAWDKHISSICQKVYGTLNNLQKFRKMTPESIRLRLVKTLILPHLDYCSFAFCNITAGQRKRLEVLLHAAIQYVYNVPFASRLTPYYVKAEILKVRERYDLEILSMTHKIVHKNCPSYLTDFATFVSDTSTRTSRAHKFKLRTPRVGLDAAENSFIVKSSRLWNNLPEKLCANTNIDSFKRSLRDMYFEGYKEA